MRMWGVDPAVMCDRHLLGEHAEMHMFVGCINRGMSIGGYVDGGLVDTSLIRRRHDSLAGEMLRRGMRHASPLPVYRIKRQGGIDIPRNEQELFRRCGRCRERMKGRR
jgi:hypothetical protein